jgi:septum formation protein
MNNNIWHFKKGFILASASINRRALLDEVRLVPDEIISPEINEDILDNELPARYVKRIAIEKAKAVQLERPGCCIVAADTVLAVGRRIIRKAKTEADAKNHLKLLSGRKHKVLTGLAIARPDGKIISRVNISSVVLKKFDEDDIRVIIESGEWKNVAGYKIDGVLSAFVKQMSGSYSSIVGIPVYETTQILRGILK